MKRETPIDPASLEPDLIAELELELQPEAAVSPAAKPAGAWTDSFRASGAKHM